MSTVSRNVSSLALNFGGGSFLFDCGEGTVRQFLKSSVKPSSIRAVFITHLHGDHYFGLPSLGMRTIDIRHTDRRIQMFAPRGLYRKLGSVIPQYGLRSRPGRADPVWL